MKKTTKNLKPAVTNHSPITSAPAMSQPKPLAPVKATPAPARPAPPSSPRVLLEIVKPGAKQVSVAGSFNQWRPEATPLRPDGKGRWVGDLAVRPGRHEYLFVVDGQWLPDPNAKEFVANPFGGKNSVLLVSE